MILTLELGTWNLELAMLGSAPASNGSDLIEAA